MSRPAQFSRTTLFLLLTTAGLSFVSGILVWRAQSQQTLDLDTPPISVQPWLTIHGALNPILCILFGFLWWQHIQAGWRQSKFRPSGMPMAAVFGMLIVSGAGLYYAGNEDFRTLLVWWHRLAGLAFPLVLLWHGALSFNRARKVQA